LVTQICGVLEEASDGVNGKLYQTEPFTVAADLSGNGTRPVTPKETHDYLKIKSRYTEMSAAEIADIDVLESAMPE
jgi:hypothetical protein